LFVCLFLGFCGSVCRCLFHNEACSRARLLLCVYICVRTCGCACVYV
jgi:hypothetical protein